MPRVRREGLTLVGLSLTNLTDRDAVQLALPFDRRANGALDVALDRVRERFGTGAVHRAVHVGHDLGPAVPLLPD
jgi:DNA polymerase-4